MNLRHKTKTSVRIAGRGVQIALPYQKSATLPTENYSINPTERIIKHKPGSLQGCESMSSLGVYSFGEGMWKVASSKQQEHEPRDRNQ